MKKTSIFLAALLAACAFLFTGCGLLDEITPVDEWEMKSVDYSVPGGTVAMDCYVIYTENGYKTKYADKSGSKLTFEPGLTILAFPDADADSELLDSAISGLTDKSYIVKTFPVNSDVEIVDEDAEEGTPKKTFKMSKAKWTLLYASLNWNEKKSTPVLDISAGQKYSQLTDLGDFSWNKLLKTILINKLLD